MAIADVDALIKIYLATCTTLVTLINTRIYQGGLPENADLPAVSYFCRGGLPANPHYPGIVTPSVQFDCWADNIIEAREVYRKLYDNLEGIQNVDVGSYQIMSAIEEGHGVDMVDVDIQGYFRVMTFFAFMIRAE